MSKYINAEVAVDAFYEMASDTDHLCTVSDYIKFLESMSDAVEIVRCKDCKWWKLSEYNTFGIHICKKFSGVRGEHDFCSRGERREDDLG